MMHTYTYICTYGDTIRENERLVMEKMTVRC